MLLIKRLRVLFVFAFSLLWGVVLLGQTPAALSNITKQDIVILFDNDVHCAIDGYAKMASLRDEVKKKTSRVLVVSSGDFASGKSLGSASKGEYLVRAMNMVGYDYVTLGNHEFDFGIPQMKTFLSNLKSKVLCCNFLNVSDNKSVYDGFEIRDFAGTKVALIGVATPATISAGTPSNFQNENGEFIYTFCMSNLAQIVQETVNEARRQGAQYVVLLSHLGTVPPGVTSDQLIAQTTGIDVVLDGHSHSVIPEQKVNNRNGESVILTSTGTEFANIGALLIHSGKMSTCLIPTSEYAAVNQKVAAEIAKIKEEYAVIGNRVIGSSDVKLTINDDTDRIRIARRRECNLGDFVSDAFRIMMDAEIGWGNGGGCRASIPAGDLTFNAIFSAFPFENQVYVVDVPGQDILDALEMSAHATPQEFGGFAQVSGLTYQIDTTIASSVVKDSNDVFVKVAGKRRVSDVRVYNPTKGKYQKLSPRKHYQMATTSFILMKGGDGLRFPHYQVIREYPNLDVDLIEDYIRHTLNGHIDAQYAKPQERVVFKSKGKKGR